MSSSGPRQELERLENKVFAFYEYLQRRVHLRDAQQAIVPHDQSAGSGDFKEVEAVFLSSFISQLSNYCEEPCYNCGMRYKEGEEDE